MDELEIEVTYLAKYIPDDISNSPYTEIIDTYIYKNESSKIRVRQQGEAYYVTKKSRSNPHDFSTHTEQTIILTEQEYQFFKQLENKQIEKVRYEYEEDGLILEIDIFKGDLEGLVTIECEFPTQREKDTFIIPDFCLADITQEKYIAGEQLQGKTYDDIAQILEKYGYGKL